MFKSFIYILFFLLCSLICSGQQTIGVPKIINYSHEQMNAGTQNWSISQDSSGIIYIANNGGLVVYNAKEWKVFGLPNKTIVRSVYIHSNGRIYVGGQDIFGYFFPDKNGLLRFHETSSSLLQTHRAFGDVWNILFFKDKVFYRSSRKIFEQSGNKFKVHTNSQSGFWSQLSVCNEKLYAYDVAEGLFEYKKNDFVNFAPALNGRNVSAILEYGTDSLLIATLKDGLFLTNGKNYTRFPIDTKIVQSQIYSCIKIDNHTYALGTVANGIFFINKSGKAIGNISSVNGLDNNIILSLFLDKEKNLWAGLDDGMTLININSAIKTILPAAGNHTATYAVNVFNHNLYIGASNGLYKTKLSLPASEDLSYSSEHFIKVPKTDGQVWGLNTINDKLMMGHHEGAFQILENTLIKYNTTGAWMFRRLPKSNNAVMGSYNGLYFLRDNGNSFKIDNAFSKDVESLRFVEVDSAHYIIWASHPYRGIYKINVSEDFMHVKSVQLLTGKHGLPTDLNNFVYKIDNEIVFATEAGIYKFDFAKNRFVFHEKFAQSIGKIPVAYMEQDFEGKIWFVTNELPGMLHQKQTKNVLYFPELRGKLVGGFYHFYTLNNRNIFIGSNNGVIHLNLEKYNASPRALHVLFNKIISIAAGKDSLLNNGYFINAQNNIQAFQPADDIPFLSPRGNSIRFEYIANNFIDNNTTYSYKLEGFDNDWSTWSLKSDKDYTNLPYGRYVFKVKAKDNFGNYSPYISYAFYIKPFWYQTLLAKFIYLLLTVFTVYLLIKIVRRRMQLQKEKYEKEQAQLKHIHELELEHNEREIIDLKNKNLENVINFKNKELATATMNLYKRSRLLSKLQNDLSDVARKIDERENRKDINKVVKLIEEEEKQNSDWEQFSIHFDDVHNHFLKRIKEIYPDLTPSEIKLAAYLKINLSSKEIAQILNISLKGVEVARYRLRKKLKIETDVNLVSFLSDI